MTVYAPPIMTWHRVITHGVVHSFPQGPRHKRKGVSNQEIQKQRIDGFLSQYKTGDTFPGTAYCKGVVNSNARSRGLRTMEREGRIEIVKVLPNGTKICRVLKPKPQPKRITSGKVKVFMARYQIGDVFKSTDVSNIWRNRNEALRSLMNAGYIERLKETHDGNVKMYRLLHKEIV
jgi:hypothetical protein